MDQTQTGLATLPYSLREMKWKCPGPSTVPVLALPGTVCTKLQSSNPWCPHPQEFSNEGRGGNLTIFFKRLLKELKLKIINAQ